MSLRGQLRRKARHVDGILGSIAKFIFDTLFGMAQCCQTPMNRAFRENHKTCRLFGLAFSQ